MLPPGEGHTEERRGEGRGEGRGEHVYKLVICYIEKFETVHVTVDFKVCS